jgi:hypothetical protein
MTGEFKRDKEKLHLEQDLKAEMKSDAAGTVSKRVHDGLTESGWEIHGRLLVDTFLWVNDFEAQHPVLGKVHGNFETEVKASSQAAYDHFVKHHPFVEWNYEDI